MDCKQSLFERNVKMILKKRLQIRKIICEHSFFFLKKKWNLLHARVTRKRSTKRLNHTGNLFRKNLQLKVFVNSRVNANKIVGQRKAFHRQRIPEPSCVRKETVDIDILVTSKNGDRKIVQSIRIKSRPPSRKREWNQLNQFI